MVICKYALVNAQLCFCVAELDTYLICVCVVHKHKLLNELTKLKVKHK